MCQGNGGQGAQNHHTVRVLPSGRLAATGSCPVRSPARHPGPTSHQKAKCAFPVAHGQFTFLVASVENPQNNCLFLGASPMKDASPLVGTPVPRRTTSAEGPRLHTGVSHHKQVSESRAEENRRESIFLLHLSISSIYLLPASPHTSCSEGDRN